MDLIIHIEITDCSEQFIKDLFNQQPDLVQAKLNKILTKLGKVKTNMDENATRIISKIDEATNAIAARLQRLIDRGDLSPEATSALEAEISRLQALGSDPENPVPDSGSTQADTSKKRG